MNYKMKKKGHEKDNKLESLKEVQQRKRLNI